MKKSTLIYLAVVAAGYAYFAYYTKKKKEGSSTKIVDETVDTMPMLEAPKPLVRKAVQLPKQLTAFSYNKKTTIKPVAKTLDTIKNAIFSQKAKPFTLNPAGQKAAKKQKDKKAKLGELGATYLYV
jgi:hypoxanthine phosphoribosyltransferase